MISEERNQLIRVEMLKALSQIGTCLFPQPIFETQIRLAFSGDLLKSEFESHLKWLEADQLIVGVRSDLCTTPKWRITEKGRTMI